MKNYKTFKQVLEMKADNPTGIEWVQAAYESGWISREQAFDFIAEIIETQMQKMVEAGANEH